MTCREASCAVVAQLAATNSCCPSPVSLLRFKPVAFLRRLAALIPPPWAHLVRHYGLFAPNAKGRDLLPAAPVSPSGMRLETELRAQRRAPPEQPPAASAAASPSTTPNPSAPPSLAASSSPSPTLPAAAQRDAVRSRRRVLPWAELLRRVFAIDLVCPRCLGPMTVIAYLTEAAVAEKILTHLGLPASPPPLAPARRPGQLELLDSDELAANRRPTPCQPRPGSRAPPRGPTHCPADDDIEPAAD